MPAVGRWRLLVALVLVSAGSSVGTTLTYWRWERARRAWRVQTWVARAQQQQTELVTLLGRPGRRTRSQYETLALGAANLDGLLHRVAEAEHSRKAVPVLAALSRSWPAVRRAVLTGAIGSRVGPGWRGADQITVGLGALETIEKRAARHAQAVALTTFGGAAAGVAALLAWAAWWARARDRGARGRSVPPSAAKGHRERPDARSGAPGAEPRVAREGSETPPDPGPGLELQQRQAAKMEALGRLAGGVAHDFNNILTVISGFGELALRRLEPGHPVQPLVENVLRASRRGSGLTTQLLVFGRRQIMSPEVVSLSGIVHGLLPMLRRLIGADVVIEAQLDHDHARTHADPTQMEQVIVNLAINARDAMAEGGTLGLRTGTTEIEGPGSDGVPPGSWATIEVRDNGRGMDAATRARIFDPFFTTKEEGTGLGLSTVYGVVKQSGGYITVDTELGSGSRFRIFLPRTDEPVRSATPPVPSVVRDEARGDLTVLVVEDAADVRALLGETLRWGGYRVFLAAEGAEALRLADTPGITIDLLVTDVVMPGMSGLELGRRMTLARPGLRVLFISGYPGEATEALAELPAGADFLPKPFAPDVFLERVRVCLSSW